MESDGYQARRGMTHYFLVRIVNKNPNIERRVDNERKKAYLLVHHHTNGALGDVPDNASASVIELVGHTLVNSSIHLDVDIVTDFEGAQVDGQRNVTFVPEGPGEQVPGAGTKPMTSRHRC